MTIHVYTLEGCSYCKSLLAELKAEGVSYVNRDANDYPIEADSIELFTQTTLYPIVHIFNDNVSIVFATYPTTNNTVREGVIRYYSIPNLVELIKQHI